MNKLRMTDFCKKYSLAQYKLHRNLSQFDTVMVEGWEKPWICLTEKNILLAMRLSSLHNVRPKSPRLSVEDFMKKYNLSINDIETRWKSLKKEEINGQFYIADTKNNLRHVKAL
jgi:hypothetical protein